MKYLFILFMLLVSCSERKTELNEDRLMQDAKQYCACHGGVNAFSFTDTAYNLICVDGMESKGTGDMTKLRLYSDCGK